MGIKGEGSPVSVAIAGQFETATKAYGEVAPQLTKRWLFRGVRLPRPAELNEPFSQQVEEWKRNGTLAFVDGAMRKGVEYTLFVAPNVPVDSKRIRSMAETVAGKLKDRRDAREPMGLEATPEIAMDDVLYGNYTAEELSGNTGSRLVRFGLMPDRFVGYDSDGYHIRTLRSDAALFPYRIPSVLDALMVWYARYERDILGTDGVLPEFGIRPGDFYGVHHTDLEPRLNSFGDPSQPWTYVDPAMDQFRLEGSDPNNRVEERYVIGSR